jgi:hypothetical protein
MAKQQSAGVRPLSEKRFWELIDWSATRSGSRQRLAALRRELVVLPTEEIVGFHQRLWQVVNAAYRWDLWGAAYLINGGCSDDGFLYFRCWLVSRGQKVYRDALRDPDTLVKVARRGANHEMEDMLSVASEAWVQRTGRKKGNVAGFEELSKGADLGFQDEPAGKEWDFDDEDQMRRRFPQLAERFMSEEEDESEEDE